MTAAEIKTLFVRTGDCHKLDSCVADINALKLAVLSHISYSDIPVVYAKTVCADLGGRLDLRTIYSWQVLAVAVGAVA